MQILPSHLSLSQILRAYPELIARLAKCKTAYEIAAVTLDLLGVNSDHAYALLPEMHGRTIRYITHELQGSLDLPAALAETADAVQNAQSGAVHKEEGFKLVNNPYPSPFPTAGVDSTADSTEKAEVVARLTAAATEARVTPAKAVEAHFRYGNSLDKVLGALTDIRDLLRWETSNWLRPTRPTGLFVNVMRHNKAVKLTEQVIRRRAEEAASRAQAGQGTHGVAAAPEEMWAAVDGVPALGAQAATVAPAAPQAAPAPQPAAPAPWQATVGETVAYAGQPHELLSLADSVGGGGERQALLRTPDGVLVGALERELRAWVPRTAANAPWAPVAGALVRSGAVLYRALEDLGRGVWRCVVLAGDVLNDEHDLASRSLRPA